MIPYGPTPLISTRGLCHAWPGSKATIALDDFDLAPGERLFLCGPSGSGKSTLLGLVSGVLSPTEGDVLLLGLSFAAMGASSRDRFRADHVGYIFQQFSVYDPLTVKGVLHTTVTENAMAASAYGMDDAQLGPYQDSDAQRLRQAFE